MKRFVAVALVVVAASSVAEAKQPTASVRRAGATWASAWVDLPRGASLRVEGRLDHRGAWTADACYMALDGSMLGAWLRPLDGIGGSLHCSLTLDGPVRGRLLVVVASRGKVARSTVTFRGRVRGLRNGGGVTLLREQDFSGVRSTAVVTFRAKANAFFATGGDGAALLSQAGPSHMTNWRLADRALALNEASMLNGTAGRYEFTVEASTRRWTLLTVADVK